MTITYRQKSRSATEVCYVDPNAFFDSVTVKVNVQPKKAGSLTVHNVTGAINMQRTADVATPNCPPESCGPANQEKLALRFSTSGSIQSKVEVQKMFADFRVLSLELEATMIAGFLPDALNIEMSPV